MPGPHSFVGSKRWSAIAAAWLAVAPGLGQQPDPAPGYVLHAYTNLMQLPALVLDTGDVPFKHLETSRFAISLGDGPKFRPAYARLQWDDPISLSILVDLSGDISDLLPELREAIPAMAPDELHGQDHVSFYALDCQLIRTVDDVAANRATLAAAFKQAADDPQLHDPQLHELQLHKAKKKAATCANSVALVDALALIARPMAKLPGRRVILVLSNGYDGKSSLRWSQVRQFAAEQSISVFNVRYDRTGAQPALHLDRLTGDFGHDIDYAENPLSALCDLTGGIAQTVSSDRNVSRALLRFVELLRGRYILEFHRPSGAKAGRYTVNVSLDHMSAHIRVGGTTVHVATAAELATPEIAPTDKDAGGKVNAVPVAPQ